MGEYLTIAGESVKIGTCENLYYTTLNQLRNCDSEGKHEYLDPAHGYRYRFPFPDEHIEMGQHENYYRGVLFSVPKELGIEIRHEKMFFRTDDRDRDNRHGTKPPAVGFHLPCIQSDEFTIKKLDWDKTAGRTIFEVVQQKIITNSDEIRTPGTTEIQTVVRCPYCGELSRLSFDEVEKLVWYVEQYPETFSDLQRQIVEIMIAGYDPERVVIYQQ